MNFQVIGAHRSSMSPALADDPFPKNRRSQQLTLPIPRKRFDPADAVERDRHVAPVSDDVNDQRIRQEFLDEREIEQMQWRTLRPSFNALLTSDGLHENAEEITGIPAFLENLWFNLFSA